MFFELNKVLFGMFFPLIDLYVTLHRHNTFLHHLLLLIMLNSEFSNFSMVNYDVFRFVRQNCYWVRTVLLFRISSSIPFTVVVDILLIYGKAA